MYPVYVEPQSWIIHILRDEDLADAVHLSNASSQMLRDAVDLIQIRAADLHVDRSRRARIQNGIDHRATGKECANVGELAGHRLLHPIHIFKTAEPVRFVQGYLDSCGVGARVGGVERGKIRNDADVRHNAFEIFWFNFMANQIFHLGHVLVGQSQCGFRSELSC